MAKSWKCARCSTAKPESAISCTGCGLIRGSVVPVTPVAPESAPTAAEPVTWATPPGPPPAPAADPALAAAVAPVTTTPLPIWRRIPIRLVLFGAILVIGAVSAWYTNAGRSSSGEITKSGDATMTDLRVGDCFDLKDPAAQEIDKVTARPCAQEHEYELFWAGTMQAGDYPAEAVFQSFVHEQCEPAFSAYVGKAFADSELDVFWVMPTSKAWSSGDRSVQCAAYHPRIHRLTGSLKGSSR